MSDTVDLQIARRSLLRGALSAALLESAKPSAIDTSTEWRNDAANIPFINELNTAGESLPFSREYDGVEDHCPFRIRWRTGPNLPVSWKGGATAAIGGRILIAGGLWMPERKNLVYSYEIKTGAYEPAPPVPYETAYTQGVADADRLVLIGGRSAGRNVSELRRNASGKWSWHALTSLPPEEGKGRWLAGTGLVPGRWLFLVAGHPTGTPSEQRDLPALPNWRMRLGRSNPQWEPMAAYPAGSRALVTTAVVKGKLYAFGGSNPDRAATPRLRALMTKYELPIPEGGVPVYRDAFSYDADADRWTAIRKVPFPLLGGAGVVIDDRFILLMGTSETKTYRAGKSMGKCSGLWTGYGDVVLCYDTRRDVYSKVGLMPYGVATCPWIKVGNELFGFGGEPYHWYNKNTETVLQIGTIEKRI